MLHRASFAESISMFIGHHEMSLCVNCLLLSSIVIVHNFIKKINTSENIGINVAWFDLQKINIWRLSYHIGQWHSWYGHSTVLTPRCILRNAAANNSNLPSDIDTCFNLGFTISLGKHDLYPGLVHNRQFLMWEMYPSFHWPNPLPDHQFVFLSEILNLNVTTSNTFLSR